MDRFFKLSLDMLSISTLEGKFTELNPAWEKVLGYTTEELQARPFIEFVHPEDRDRTIVEFSKLLDPSYETSGFENRYVCKDGSVKDLMWKARQDPECQRIYAIARDVTDLKRAQADLERFAFHAAHDLQEPLRKISAFGDRLNKTLPNLDGRPRQYLDKMLEASHRMSRLIHDLLEYARLNREAELEEVDLNELMGELIADLELSIAQAGAQVNVSGLCTLRGDWTRLRQLFQNLLSNAIKFRRPDVPLSVSIHGRQLPGILEVTVQDNGIGFEEKYREKIFQVFQRLHGRGEYEGTGIGLALCARIVERHGGTIDARSVPGEGSVFVVTLARAEKVESDA